MNDAAPSGARRAVDVGEVAPELEQECKRDQDAGERDARVVQHLVAEAREAERGRDDASRTTARLSDSPW